MKKKVQVFRARDFWCFPFRPVAYIVSHVVAMFGMQISEEHVLHHFENVYRSRFLFCKQENRGVHCASMSTATESIPASVRSFVVGIERSKLGESCV